MLQMEGRHWDFSSRVEDKRKFYSEFMYLRQNLTMTGFIMFISWKHFIP